MTALAPRKTIEHNLAACRAVEARVGDQRHRFDGSCRRLLLCPGKRQARFVARGPGTVDTLRTPRRNPCDRSCCGAPYILTALIERPKRLVYVSSGMHRGVRSRMDDLLGTKRSWSGSSAYAERKLCDVLLAFAVARRWNDVKSNAWSLDGSRQRWAALQRRMIFIRGG